MKTDSNHLLLLGIGGAGCTAVRGVMQRAASGRLMCCNSDGIGDRGKKEHDAVLIGIFFVLLRTEMNFATLKAGTSSVRRCCLCCIMTDKCIHPYIIY